MGQFQPGVSGNPAGRPKGSSGGRVQALAALDVMLGKRKNQRALVKALEEELQGNPVRFFKTIIMPLLPREAKLSLENDGMVQWQSLLTISPTKDSSRSIGPGTSDSESSVPVDGSERPCALPPRSSIEGDVSVVETTDG